VDLYSQFVEVVVGLLGEQLGPLELSEGLLGVLWVDVDDAEFELESVAQALETLDVGLGVEK
jgi:hypothetical protein